MRRHRALLITLFTCAFSLSHTLTASASVYVYSDSWPDHQLSDGLLMVWSYGSAENDGGGAYLSVDMEVTGPGDSFVTSETDGTEEDFVDVAVYWALRENDDVGDYETYASADLDGYHQACTVYAINYAGTIIARYRFDHEEPIGKAVYHRCSGTTCPDAVMRKSWFEGDPVNWPPAGDIVQMRVGFIFYTCWAIYGIPRPSC
jgi:hypothetical protein